MYLPISDYMHIKLQFTIYFIYNKEVVYFMCIEEHKDYKYSIIIVFR